MPAQFKLVRGVRILTDGREVCVTQAAWNRRRQEVLKRAGHRCECREDCQWHRGRRCKRMIGLAGWLTHIHHRTRRGTAGAKRDDRIENLEANCVHCHMHGENK